MIGLKSTFAHKRPFTIGVEEEYMLCHPETGDLVDRADQIIGRLKPEEQPRFSYELILSEIETNTPVAESVAETMVNIKSLRQRVRDLGKEFDYRIGMSGTHPTALADDQHFVDSEGYRWVASQLRYYAMRNITFAMHVHVALPDGESAIAVTNASRRWLAPLLALSANSPFFQAHDTGMLSSRTFQFGAFPRTNIPGTFKSFDHFERVLNTYLKMGSINLPRQIWWKIRPHGAYGTIEFRICDVQRSLKRTEMLVALSQALSHRIYQEHMAGILVDDFELEYINDAIWKATRFGLDAKLTDPFDEQILTQADMIERMVEYVRPSLIELGTENIVETVEQVVQAGCEAEEQRVVFHSEGFIGLKRMLMDRVEFD